MAFSPRYAKNHLFYVDYTDQNGDTRVDEYRPANGVGDPGTARQLLFVDQPYPNHNGGQLQFDRHGYLYVGMGDGGSGGDPENRAQNLSSQLGKLLRIDPKRASTRWRSSATGCATRGGSRSTARPATSGSATSARTRGRRSTSAPRRRWLARELRLVGARGPRRSSRASS